MNNDCEKKKEIIFKSKLKLRSKLNLFRILDLRIELEIKWIYCNDTNLLNAFQTFKTLL